MLDTLSVECENFEIKDYFNKLNLAESRLKFRLRSNSVYTCRTMFSSDPENFKANFECFHCHKLDILSHWKYCSEYSKIIKSKKLNLNTDADLLEFYREVIHMRTKV